MNSKLKTNKGITLIALIITIIILLILAIVSIRLVISGGLMSKTQDATIKHKVAEIEERLKLILNDEKISRTTRKENYEMADETIYTDILESLFADKTFSLGNLYEKSTGKIITQKLTIFPTDLIYDKYEIIGEIIGEIPEELKYKFINIEVNVGNQGYISEIEKYYEKHETIPTKDIFAIDEKYNLYYIDEQGNIYSTKQKYEPEKFELGESFFNPDLLPEEEKKIYDKIYDEALFFSENEEYAKKISDLYFTVEQEELFLGGGFSKISFFDESNQIVEVNGNKLENLAYLMQYPEGKLGEISLEYYYLMDSQYNMYQFNGGDQYTGYTVIYRENNDKKTMIVKKSELTENEKSYQDYKYIERFDNKNVKITSVPNTEIVDMQKDLYNLNIYTIDSGLLDSKNVKRLILPDTLKTLTDSIALKNMGVTSFKGVFEGAKSLEYIKIPNNVKYIYSNTFKGCTNLKEVIMPDNIEQIGSKVFEGCNGTILRFKHGVALPGEPWGGTNIKIERK